MTGVASSQSNPFVGPRSFRTGEVLYGRDRETRKLVNLLIAERIVLLHAPSGAGKTSLIQAAVVPQMRERGFEVFPTIRLNAVSPPAPQGATKMLPAANRYVWSALLALEEQHERAERTFLARRTELVDDRLRADHRAVHRIEPALAADDRAGGVDDGDAWSAAQAQR